MKQITLLIATIITLQSLAQSHVSGIVLSSAGKLPLAGVTVTIKGNTLSTTTNTKGAFSIVADSSSILVFTHIGYLTQQLKPVSGQLTVILQPSSSVLSEVTISTGYQEIPNERTTGSFSSIGQQLLNRTVTTDIISKLEGTTTALYFSKVNNKTELAVRGLSTINAGTQPLVVLDNFPYEGDVNDINPNDIESVTVLKDASAASIWGAKAGNGVIIITSKKSAFNQKPRVSFNSNLTIQQKPDLLYSPAFLNSNDFIDLEKFLFDKGFYNSALNNTGSRPVISPVVEILAKARAGALSSADAAALINGYRSYDVRNQEAAFLYRKSVKQQYALSFSGGSSFISYLFSLGFDDTKNNLVNNGGQRKTLNTVFTIKPFSKLEIGAALSYTVNNNNNGGVSYLTTGGGKTAIYPYARIGDENGAALPLEQNYRLAYLDTAGAGLLLDWKYRPLDEIYLRKLTTASSHILARVSAKYSFTRALNAELKYAIEKSGGQEHNYTPVESFYARNLINLYSQRNGALVKQNIPYGGYLDQSFDDLNSYSLRGQLNYTKSWKGRHQLSAILGSELRNTISNASSVRTYGYDDNNTTFANVDYLTTFTQWGNLGSNTIPNNIDFSSTTNRFVSFYSNASYTYHSKYTLTASARKDASNIFGVNANNRWRPLWSIGAAYNLSSENFYHWSALPLLKLRTSYGYNGNLVPTPALATIRYSPANATTNLIFASVSAPPNPDLHWEKVRIFNSGLDFASKNQRISGSIDYYRKNAIDLVGPTPVDPTSGVSSMNKNTASLVGHGLDLDLTVQIIRKPFNWQSQLFFSYVTNKITGYRSGSFTSANVVDDGYNIAAVQGQKPYSLASYRWAGLDPQTGDPLGYYNGSISKDYSNITGQPTINDIVFGGTTRPPFFGSWLNTFSYKGFSLSANIAWKFKYLFRRQTLNYTSLFNSWVGNIEYAQRWQKPGDEKFTNVPSLVYPAVSKRDQFYSLSEASVEKGDLIRLQDVNLNYTFNKIHLGKKELQSLQLYIYASNFGILWRANKKGLDPDYGTATPPSQSISLGLKTIF